MTGNPKELDVIFDKMGYTKNTDFRKDAIRLITDWHNKQLEEMLDRLDGRADFSLNADSHDKRHGVKYIPLSAIEAERNKLKEVK